MGYGRMHMDNERNMEVERLYLFLLCSLPGISGKKVRAMRQFAGSYKAAYELDMDEYLKQGIFSGRGRCYGYRERHKDQERLIREYEELKNLGIGLAAEFDRDYPVRLMDLEDPPPLLFYRGGLPRDGLPSASVIGSRACSGYGAGIAARIAEELCDAGICLISGMAEGIDSAAQRAALRKGHDSFAILGSGVNHCYPMESYDIYELMCAGQGGVISEYPVRSAPEPWRFVQRNRIIAALSDVVIVAEARKRSGTSITVEYALSCGREVFSVPHRLGDELGEGCNLLIRDGASIFTCTEDVLSSGVIAKRLSAGDGGIRTKERAGKKEEKTVTSLASSEKIVYSCLDFNPKHIEDIAAQTGLGMAAVLRALLCLEKRRLACSVSSFYYRKVS